MTPFHWFAIAAGATVIVQILAWPLPWSLFKGGAKPAPAKPTAQEAFAAVEVLAIYKAKCKDDPAYVGVQAATKAQLEAP